MQQHFLLLNLAPLNDEDVLLKNSFKSFKVHFFPTLLCNKIWKQARYPALATYHLAQYLCFYKDTIFLKLWFFWPIHFGE